MADIPFDADLFDLLVCPLSRAPLKWCAANGGEGRLVSTAADSRRAFRVEAGIPIMLLEESTVLPQAEWDTLMRGPGPVGGGPDAVRRRQSAAASG